MSVVPNSNMKVDEREIIETMFYKFSEDSNSQYDAHDKYQASYLPAKIAYKTFEEYLSKLVGDRLKLDILNELHDDLLPTKEIEGFINGFRMATKLMHECL